MSPICESNVLSKKYLLVCSSFLFLIPAFVGVDNKFTQPLSVLYATTSIFSINRWNDPFSITKRNMDLKIARISFLITLLTGIRVIKDTYRFYIGINLAICIVICYGISRYLGHINSKKWYIAHIIMHILVSSGMMMVVKNLKVYY